MIQSVSTPDGFAFELAGQSIGRTLSKPDHVLAIANWLERLDYVEWFRLIGALLPEPALDFEPATSTILALDLGETTGWAGRNAKGKIISGTWSLKPGRSEGPGARYVRLKRHLAEVHELWNGIELVAVELVVGHAPKQTYAAQLYGGYLASVQKFVEVRSIPLIAVHTAHLKRHATGDPRAKKPEIVAAARRRWPKVEIVDDNQADALWLLDGVVTARLGL